MEPLLGGFASGQVACFFRRPTTPNDGIHVNIDVRGTTRLLWAFNPRPGINYLGDAFTYHEENHRGAVAIQWGSGRAVGAAVISVGDKKIHGFGMMAIWLLFLPFGAFYARYMRSWPGWLYVKVTVQVASVVGILAFFLVILNNVIYLDQPHAILGLTIISLVFVQLFLGVFSLLGLSQEFMQIHYRFVRLSHYVVGFGLLLAAVAQMALGIDTLFPWVEPRGKEVWGIFIGAVGFWILAFGGTELYWRLRVVRADSSSIAYSRAPTGDGKGFGAYASEHGGMGGTPANPVDAYRQRNALSIGAEFEDLMLRHQNESGIDKFTWESLAEAVDSGRMLVVGNNKYIYDISKWVYSHPGGQIILHAVNGTDITNDYFHEAGFDAEDFVPRSSIPKQRPGRNGATLPRERLQEAAKVIARDGTQSSMHSWVVSAVGSQDMQQTLPNLTETDWQRLVKARRTHVHTRVAIQRLSQLLVGELVPSSEALDNQNSSHTLMSDLARSPRLFDRFEYRRYALTAKEMVTSHSTATPIFKLRFCLLYPYDVRDGAPREFLPGECIEIQTRISNRLVSRYYTPLPGGDLTVFEIHVKNMRQGTMSTFLARQTSGDRQFKIRGPFGGALVHVQRPLRLGTTQWIPDRLVFVAGGTGIAPLLQLIGYVFLPTLEKIRVIADYDRRFEDELTLRKGDSVIVKHHFNDGWCQGIHAATGAEGVFPLLCTAPRCGPRTRIILINCVQSADDIIGRELISAAMLAYPLQFEVHHFVENRAPRGQSPIGGSVSGGSSVNGNGNGYGRVSILNGVPSGSSLGVMPAQPLPQPVALPDVPGLVHDGRLSDQRLTALLQPIWDRNQPGNQRCIVCGPPGFAPFVVDVLTEFGAHNSDISIMPHDQYVSFQ
nr:hypothetical protein HK105_000617 [Polyrhizophydium stewartii]